MMMTIAKLRRVPLVFIIKQLFCIALGALMSAVAINLFLVPHKFVSGGISGFSLFSHYMWPLLPVGAWIALYNVPIFLVGWRYLGRGFLLGSLFGTALLSFFTFTTEWMAMIKFVHDPMLAAIFSGLLQGAGIGITLRVNGSLGGTDIIAAIMLRHQSISIGTISFILNAIIIAVAGSVFGVEMAAFALVSIFVSSMALDKTIRGINTSKAIFIITKEPKAIADEIMTKLDRGVTFIEGVGAYSKADIKVLYCVVSLRQLARVKYYVRTIDPKAFMSVADVSEVMGKGFKPSPF